MSEIKYLTHREAAQARLNGEELLWDGMAADYSKISLSLRNIDTPSPYHRAPRVFTHPGGTCPAPEMEAPPRGQTYWLPPTVEAGFAWSHTWVNDEYTWVNDEYDNRALSLGLVYLTREAAIARAELMLAGVAK